MTVLLDHGLACARRDLGHKFSCPRISQQDRRAAELGELQVSGVPHRPHEHDGHAALAAAGMQLAQATDGRESAIANEALAVGVAELVFDINDQKKRASGVET